MQRRILLLVTDLEIGGTPTVVRELALRLRHEEGVLVEVACLGRWGPVADQLHSAGVKVTALKAGGIYDVRVIWRLLRLVRDGEFNTVLSFLIHSNALAAGVSLFCRKVRFVQSIQTAQTWPRWHWWVQRMVQHAARWILVPSESVAKMAERRAGVAREKIVVIPNAVDAAEYEVNGLPPSGPFPIGFLGRLDPIKRVEDLLEAVRLLGDGVHLHVFGDGEARASLEARIGELGIGDRVTMHGAVDRPQPALRRMGVLVLPSEAEGFGLVLIEAMACGVPVVATNVAGICDVVCDGETGLLVPARSPEKLAEAIGRILNEPQLRERLVRQAGEEVRRRFAWEKVMGLYREVLGLGK